MRHDSRKTSIDAMQEGTFVELGEIISVCPVSLCAISIVALTTTLKRMMANFMLGISWKFDLAAAAFAKLFRSWRDHFAESQAKAATNSHTNCIKQPPMQVHTDSLRAPILTLVALRSGLNVRLFGHRCWLIVVSSTHCTCCSCCSPQSSSSSFYLICL